MDITRSCSFSGELCLVGQRSRNGSVYSVAPSLLGANLFKSDQQQKSPEAQNKRDRDLPRELVAGRPWINNKFHSMRWIVITLCGLNMSLMMFSRLSITVSIIDMVNQTETTTSEVFNNETSEYIVETATRFLFDWDNTIQFFIISIYMVSYGIPQVSISIMVANRGGHIIGAISAVVSLVATGAIPLIAHLGWEHVSVMRLILGAAHAATMSIGVRMIEVWIPASETTKSVTLIQFLGCTGVVFNPIISGYLTAINWTHSFYVPCLMILTWLVLWLVLVRDNPEDCWLISQQELRLILNERNYQNKTEPTDNGSTDGQYVLDNPWLDIFKTPSLYALLFIWSCVCSTATCFLFILPNFLNQLAKVEIDEIGRIIFIIQSGALLSYLWGLKLLSYLMSNNYSILRSRQIVYTISVIMCAISWILPSVIDGDPAWMCLMNRLAHPVAEIIVIGTILDNFSNSGMSTSVFGVVNTIGNLSSFPSAIIIGRILDDYGTNLTLWHTIFIGFAGANILALICYLTVIQSKPVEFKHRGKKSGPV